MLKTSINFYLLPAFFNFTKMQTHQSNPLRSFTFLILFLLSLSAFCQSYSDWNNLLKKHVSEKGEVNYSAFLKDQSVLNDLIKKLSANPPARNASKNEIVSYWTNLYNAATIQIIIKNYPIKSIMELENGKVWDLKFIKVGPQQFSLNEIEHEILRKKFFDPRLHFVLNCASKSCPKLHNQAFTENNIELSMDQLAREFINNNQKNVLQTNSIELSQLFNWYKDDFTVHSSLTDFLNQYSKEKINSSANISFMEYDWSLNSIN